MQKWTTSISKNPSSASVGGVKSHTGVNKVSLSKILSIRPNLNEIECWALLGQTAHALQDVLLKANGHFGSAKKINDNCPVIYPKRVLATTTGRIVIDNNFDTQFDAMKPEFIHPLLKTSQLYRDGYRLVLSEFKKSRQTVTRF